MHYRSPDSKGNFQNQVYAIQLKSAAPNATTTILLKADLLADNILYSHIPQHTQCKDTNIKITMSPKTPVI